MLNGILSVLVTVAASAGNVDPEPKDPILKTASCSFEADNGVCTLTARGLPDAHVPIKMRPGLDYEGDKTCNVGLSVQRLGNGMANLNVKVLSCW